MTQRREDIIKMIVDERLKQLENPNTRNDIHKTKNDWTACIGFYLFETASRPDKHVTFDEFRQSLVKAAAIILAALETSLSHEDDIVKLLNEIGNKDESNNS